MFSAVETLYSEIAPNLFMGGTDDEDTIHVPQRSYAPRKDLPFDAIITLYAWARPADWHIQEFRYGFPDASIQDIDLKRLKLTIEWGYQQWMRGDRLLVRCQAGLNRSGLVTALILMQCGLSGEEAIALIREKRTSYALCNNAYEAWLLESAANYLKDPALLAVAGTQFLEGVHE